MDWSSAIWKQFFACERSNWHKHLSHGICWAASAVFVGRWLFSHFSSLMNWSIRRRNSTGRRKLALDFCWAKIREESFLKNFLGVKSPSCIRSIDTSHLRLISVSKLCSFARLFCFGIGLAWTSVIIKMFKRWRAKILWNLTKKVFQLCRFVGGEFWVSWNRWFCSSDVVKCSFSCCRKLKMAS